MAEKIKKCGIKKEEGFLYFVDKSGDIACVKASRGNQKGGEQRKIKKTGIIKEAGYLYFIDKAGDIGRAPMKNSEIVLAKAKRKKPATKQVKSKQALSSAKKQSAAAKPKKTAKLKKMNKS